MLRRSLPDFSKYLTMCDLYLLCFALYIWPNKIIPMVHLLLVEDEISLLQVMQQYLENEKYQVTAADTFKGARKEIAKNHFDVALIDINLPDGNGNSLINDLKTQDDKTGIIIVSSDNLTDDKIRSLDLGADDYLTKPFDLQELNARIRSVIRRKQPEVGHKIEADGITLFPNNYKAVANDKEIGLTKKEFELLLYLISNKNRLVTKEMLVLHLWNINIDSYDNVDFIYTHVKNLRKKLIAAGAKDHIKNMHGIGYSYVTE